MPNPPPLEQLDELSELIFRGQKIQAIKLYREATGAGLKEAKDEIEAMEALLRYDSPGKFIAKPGAGGRFWATTVFCFCCGVVIYWILRK